MCAVHMAHLLQQKKMDLSWFGVPWRFGRVKARL